MEHLDMSARLLANIGVVHECLGEYDKGIELLRKSVNICKQHDLYEQLERCYTFLGSLFMRKQEYNNAIHHYNLAIEVAGKVIPKFSFHIAADRNLPAFPYFLFLNIGVISFSNTYNIAIEVVRKIIPNSSYLLGLT